MLIELKILNKDFYYKNSIECGKELDNCLGCEEYNKHYLPCYATSGSAALDLMCTEDVTIYPGETKMIHTGLAIWLGSAPKLFIPREVRGAIGIAGIILPRSGLGTKGLVLANTIGLIDEDYQGELKIAAWNRNDRDYEWHPGEDPEIIKIKAGDRIAQLMFMPVIKTQFDIVEEFSNVTDRGEGGFGHTDNV